MTLKWRTLGALTEKVVQREALRAWLTARVLKGEQRRQKMAKKESGSHTGLVNFHHFIITYTSTEYLQIINGYFMNKFY